MIPWIQTLDPANPIQSLLPYIPSSIPSPLLELFHNHASHDALEGHEHAAIEGHAHAVLNPHAAWFALVSVVVKEWLFRVTKKVADDEHSPVLLANAYQYVPSPTQTQQRLTPLLRCALLRSRSHRSDALTSGVALFSILGSHYGAPILDPLGGLIVSIFILHQGLSLSRTSCLELLDKGISEEYRAALERIAEPLVNGTDLLEIRNIRGVKAGGLTSLDLTITVPPTMSVLESHAVEANVRETIMRLRKEVRELKIHVHAQEEGEVLTGLGAGKDRKEDGEVKHDFGRNGC
jgi:divalent metal cation (Fe/Co/Zn/Cd) transporter